jgi:hypothetical protein
MKNCPLCGHEVESYHELTQTEPYIHNSPFDGLMIYGAFTAPKETLCYDGKFMHFAFWDAENNLVGHRLVQLGVENPTTKSPTDEFWEGYNDRDPQDFDDPEEWEEVTSEDDLYNDNEDDLPF